MGQLVSGHLLLCFLSLLEKIQKEGERHFLLPFRKARGILRLEYQGFPLPLKQS